MSNNFIYAIKNDFIIYLREKERVRERKRERKREKKREKERNNINYFKILKNIIKR